MLKYRVYKFNAIIRGMWARWEQTCTSVERKNICWRNAGDCNIWWQSDNEKKIGEQRKKENNIYYIYKINSVILESKYKRQEETRCKSHSIIVRHKFAGLKINQKWSKFFSVQNLGTTLDEKISWSLSSPFLSVFLKFLFSWT